MRAAVASAVYQEQAPLQRAQAPQTPGSRGCAEGRAPASSAAQRPAYRPWHRWAFPSLLLRPPRHQVGGEVRARRLPAQRHVLGVAAVLVRVAEHPPHRGLHVLAHLFHLRRAAPRRAA
eukprot:scaffold2585_cov368-Prasinococcus_capsulatus_cf.AAC.15